MINWYRQGDDDSGWSRWAQALAGEAPVEVAKPVTRGCKADGCPCKDARIVSQRTAAFVKARRPDATPFRDPATLTPISAY